ncbi:MAG: zinc ribbon domain-containing protein [Acidobacteriota bacterium]|nr:zinc ribbon domain-containing protein [Acidobacteriota bacterium]
MNAVKCPNCGNLNSLGENFCLQCGTSLPQSAQVSLSPEQHAQAFGINPSSIFIDPERGRRVFFWYRIYAAMMALLYAGVAAVGVFILLFAPSAPTTPSDEADPIILGSVYAVVGVIFFFPFAAALVLPKKPWTWVYHIVLICIGMTSCCLVPFTIPLLINWLKPETKALFGRS